MAQNAILKITPAKDIVFSGSDFSQTKTEHLHLENISSTNVAFKVKTTALKAYLVRPSSHVLHPGESVNVQIMLQRMSEVPPNGQHRFLVQALQTTEDAIDSREQWFMLARQNPIQEYRLAVVFPDVNGNKGGEGKPAGASNQTDLKNQYDEIVKYAEKLQEQRKLVVDEIGRLEGQESNPSKKGYSMVHLVIAVILSLLVCKVVEKLQKDGVIKF